jgi:hypothetical protein
MLKKIKRFATKTLIPVNYTISHYTETDVLAQVETCWMKVYRFSTVVNGQPAACENAPNK